MTQLVHAARIKFWLKRFMRFLQHRIQIGCFALAKLSNPQHVASVSKLLRLQKFPSRNRQGWACLGWRPNGNLLIQFSARMRTHKTHMFCFITTRKITPYEPSVSTMVSKIAQDEHKPVEPKNTGESTTWCVGVW